MTERRHRGTVVIGLGNPLMGDDGVGLAALAALQDRWSFRPSVEFVDGGTWGMDLLHVFEEASRVLLLDAINLRKPPGLLVVLQRDELPGYLSLKVSPHQIDLREVLAVAQLRDTLPPALVAVGLQPARIEMSTELSIAVAAHLTAMVEQARAVLEEWGHRAVARELESIHA